jgi:hypothetical protein
MHVALRGTKIRPGMIHSAKDRRLAELDLDASRHFGRFENLSHSRKAEI